MALFIFDWFLRAGWCAASRSAEAWRAECKAAADFTTSLISSSFFSHSRLAHEKNVQDEMTVKAEVFERNETNIHYCLALYAKCLRKLRSDDH